MKEVTISKGRLEFALEMVDKDIMQLMRKADYFGCDSVITMSYLDELKGSLTTLLYLGLISRDEFHNISVCLHGFIFGRDLDLSDLDSDQS